MIPGDESPTPNAHILVQRAHCPVLVAHER